MKNIYLAFSIILILQLPILAQDIKPKQAIDKKELEEMKENWRLSVDMAFNFTISETLLSGDYAKNEKELEERKQDLKNKLAKDPQNPDLLRRLAIFYEGKEKEKYLEEAYNIVGKSLEKDSNNGENYFKMAEIFYAAESYENAYKAYQKASELTPKKSEAWSQLAFFSINQRQYKEVQKLTSKAIEIDPENISAQIIYFQSFLFQALEKLSQTEDSDGKANIDYSKLEALSKLFPNKKAYKVLENSAHVLEIFYKVMIRSSNAMDRDEEPDFANFFKTSKEELIEIKHLEQFFKKALKNKDASELFIQDALATLNILQNNSKDAITYLENILKVDKRSSGYYYNIAFVHAVREDWKSVENLIKEKMKKNATARDYRIWALSKYERDDLSSAIQIIKESEAKFPNNSQTYYLRAVLEYKNNNLKTTSDYCLKAIDLDKKNGELYLLNAVISLEQEEWKKAYSALEEAEVLRNEEAVHLKKKYFD